MTAALASALLGLPVASGTARATDGRFFATARQCESARALASSGCQMAFSNALAEYAAKVPLYASRRACLKAFGPCMPWPIGTRRFSRFRPQWIGVTLAKDGTAVPAVAPGRLRFDFASQSTDALSAAATVAAPVPAPDGESPRATIMTPDGAGDGDAGAGPAPRAGGGFTMIDGVLTYPAPARFQPGALKHP